MITLRPADERGHIRLDWLDTYHTFSFGQYLDQNHMGISNLRVINDDRIDPGGGFPTHGHQDMEILTYVLDGALEHRDSMGNGSVIRPGDVQHMSAGRGVRHSEHNASAQYKVHLLQIWLTPNRSGVTPAYHQLHFPPVTRRGRLALLASPDGRDGSIPTQQDALFYGTTLRDGETVIYPLAADRQAYVHVARGHAIVNDQALAGGDGVHLRAEAEVRIRGAGPDGGEALLFDLT